MKKLFLLSFIFLALITRAQSLGSTITARYPSLGAYSKANIDLYATRNNAAALAQLPVSCAGVYTEKRFLQNQLNFHAASVGVKTKSGGIGLHLNYYGFNLYNQTQISLAYGLKLDEKMDIGAQFNYHTINQGNGYGKASSINASIGVTFHITDKIHAGMNIYNPGSSKWNKIKDEKIPSQYTFGIGYDISGKLFISTEIVKEENTPVNVNTGIQYRFVEQFFVRAGVATATSSFFTGVGFSLPRFRIDLSTSYHPQLGLSPGVLLLFDFENKHI